MVHNLVYFDTHKNQRITSDRVKSIMNRVLRAELVFSKIKRDVKVNIGAEEIVLDYKKVTMENELNNVKSGVLSKEGIWLQV
ncbi:MAG: hypothetical protein ACYDEJ_17150 [Desulfitobacteriaceae bacterium]